MPNNPKNQDPNFLTEEQVAALESAGAIAPVNAPPIDPNQPSTFVGAPPAPSGRDPFSSGTLPPNFGLQPDLVNAAGYGPGNIPEYRLMPIQNGPQLGSAIRSVVTDVLKNTTIIQENSTPTTTTPTAQPFDNSDNLATTQYVDESSFYGVGVAGFRDDFISGDIIFSVPVFAGTLNFDTPWVIYPIGSGSAPNLFIESSSFQNPGVITFLTDGLHGSGYGLTVVKGGNSANTGTLGYLGRSTNWQADFILNNSIVSTGCFRIGFIDSGHLTSDPPNNGIWVRYDTGAGDTQFTWECRADSVSTTSTLNSIPIDSNFHHFRIRSITVGTILFSVDGGSETAISTNVQGVIPFAGSMCPGFQVFSRGASSTPLSVDFFSYIARTGRT